MLRLELRSTTADVLEESFSASFEFYDLTATLFYVSLMSSSNAESRRAFDPFGEESFEAVLMISHETFGIGTRLAALILVLCGGSPNNHHLGLPL